MIIYTHTNLIWSSALPGDALLYAALVMILFHTQFYTGVYGTQSYTVLNRGINATIVCTRVSGKVMALNYD